VNRIFVLSFLPLMLFALEKVNLMKDGGFEKNNEIWNAYGGGLPLDTAIADRHDSVKYFSGSYSGSCETRIVGASSIHADSAVLIQGFSSLKVVSDLDSLFLQYSVLPREENFERSWCARIALHLNAGEFDSKLPVYRMKAPNATVSPPPNVIFLEVMNFPSDTDWHSFARDIRNNILDEGISVDAKVDSFFLLGWGGYLPPWCGQKIYWDDIRLTGYADYDVGVKAILPRDSIGNAYTPTARIKNFGRKATDSFLVIAQIEAGQE
jgi:hypothetical protein